MDKGSIALLPIDGYLEAIVDVVRTRRAVVVTATPGAGKTTRVPPVLAEDGRVLLLQPRRVAARAIARRIADEQGWSVGREVGWHVRFDRRDSAETRLLVVTEGILTARLQHDPLLSDVRTVVLDEFHERSVHTDLGLALVKQAWIARDDLRIVVMSATIDAAPVAAFLDGCPVVDVPGRSFPIDVAYRPGAAVEDVVAEAIDTADTGAVLAFLPGAREIAQAAARIAARVGPRVDVCELHGGLDADAQDAALTPTGRPRVIVATNIAETTLTVPDVTRVVDAGWQKVARYDAGRGIDRLETERVSRDAADQRAGRAGRLGPGRAFRLWEAHLRLAPHRSPDIARVDLASPALEVLAWGADPRTFAWFEPPRADRLDAAIALLVRIGAVDDAGRLTDVGRRLHRLPLHPRLARLLDVAGGAPAAARAVALLSERVRLAASPAATACDLWSAAHDAQVPTHVARIARDVRQALQAGRDDAVRDSIDEETFRRAVLAAYPDRVGRRRGIGSDRIQLASGTGARLGRESGVVSHEFLVAIDVSGSSGDPAGEAIVHMACGIERDWLTPTSSVVEHVFDRSAGIVRAHRIARYDALVLSSTETMVDPTEVGQLMTEALIARGPDEGDRRLLARCAMAGIDVAFEAAAREAGPFLSRLEAFALADHLPAGVTQRLAREAPVDLALPSGRRARLEYRDDGRVMAAVKLQELFGLAETPRLGGGRVPVTFELLAPNGRPVQVTSDLRSFWTTTYQDVRKELRARYPRHPWPEDPWTAQATHRTVRRR